GMQYFDEIARGLKSARGDVTAFDAFLFALFDAQDDVAENGESQDVFETIQQTWKLMDGVSDYHPACAKVLQGLIEGLAAGCGRHIPVHLKPSPNGKAPFVWSIG